MPKAYNPPTLHALSLSQMNIWHLEQAYKGTSINNICATIRIRGVLDIALLQKSLNLVLASDINLRTRLKLVEGVPYQYYAEEESQQFPVFDFSLTNKKGADYWETVVTRELMPLFDAPLYAFAIFKLGENEGGILVKTHHIISDGWSQVLFCNRIAETYLELLSGREPSLAPAPSYQLHVEKERAYLDSATYKRDRAYWAEKMADFLEPSSIKECKSAAVSPVGQRRTYRLSQTLNHAVHAFCTRNRVAPFAVFYMALAIYLQRIRAADRLAVGVPIFNRVNMTDKETTGMFVSTLPFLSRLDDEWTFEEFNRQLADQWYELLRYQKLPFPEILELARERQPQASRLFHLVLSYQTSKVFKSREADLIFSGRWNYSGYQSEHLLIHLSSMEDEAGYSVDYDYLTQIFSEEEIDRLHGYLVNILTEALAHPERPLWQLAILGQAEKEQVLFSFNQTDLPLYDATLQDTFCRVAGDHGARAAVIHAGRRLTYGELKRRALCWAKTMEASLSKAAAGKKKPEENQVDRQKTAGGYAAEAKPEPTNAEAGPELTDQVVALFLPKSPDLIIAMTAVMLSGNSWVILPQDTPRERLLEILEDSGARLILSTAELAAAMKLACQPVPWLDTGLLQSPSSFGESSQDYLPKAGCLAYLGYTSGSTGKPKGVEIRQISLLNFAKGMAPLFCHRHGAVLSLCSTGFDVFVMESMAALLTGQTIVLPEEGEQEDPARLAALIRNYAVGFMALTPSRLEAFMKNPAFLSALQNLESLVLGGEHCPGQLLKDLKQQTKARIYNQYGPTETTIGVSWQLLNNAELITIGRPMPNCRIYILDKHLNPLPVGVYGDLYIGGLCVGKGYRGKPALTQECFLTSPFESGERIYRTGDVGCWTEDGEILLGGRKDQQIKLRGLRVEPQEIAMRLALHPDIRQAAVKVCVQEGKPFLAAYYTAGRDIPQAELYQFALSYLPNYMLPGYLQRIEEIPLTTNGKVDYARLPEPRPALRGQGPADDCQTRLLAIFSRVLKRDDLDADSDYFRFGGDSLNAMEVLVEVEAVFGVALRVADLYACRTVRLLAEKLSAPDLNNGPAGGADDPDRQPAEAAVSPAPILDDYPLTPTQLSLYFESQLDPAGLAYNIPGAFRLPEGADPLRLENAFRRLIAAEPLFRTAIIFTPQGLRQKIYDQAEFSLTYLEAADFNEAQKAFVKPFELSSPPLLRAALWREQSGRLVLFMDMHHIISDGISTSVYLNRLDRLYREESILPEGLQYKDYAYWLDRRQEKEEALAYWRRRLALPAQQLELPPEGRPKAFDFQGAKYAFGLDEAESRACQEYCDKRQLTPYMFFAAVFGLLLSKASGNTDFIVGTPVSGRTRRELMEMPGAFMHPLPLRLTPRKDLTLARWLEQVKADVLDMITYQGCPLAELTAMAAEASGGEAPNQPLYRTMFHYRPLSPSSFKLDGQPLEFLPLETSRAKLDLNLEGARENGCFRFWLEYASSLFDETTIALYSRSFAAIAADILRDDQQKIGQISAVSPEDRLRLLEKPNRCRLPYEDRCLDQLFDDMAEILPRQTAVYWHDQSISYRELQRRSDALAAHLSAAGARPGDIVALAHQRTPDIITALLGILKAGCAYLPVLTSFPEKRLSYMLEHGGVRLLLCDEASRQELPAGLPCRLVADPDYNDTAALETLALSFQPPAGRSLDDKMHVLYTSGTTGQPKGAVLCHRPLTNLLYCMVQYLEPAGPNVLCCSNVIFDTFITETLLSLALGKTVIMADEEEMLLPWKMGRLIRERQVGFLQLTPSRLQLSLGNHAFADSLEGIKVMLICGETFPPQLLEKVKKLTGARILNACGPTECAVYVTMEDITDVKGRLPIGKPFSNCRFYVLDDDLRPVMPTAKGELYLGGHCLGAGYLNRPDLTEKAFLDDPFHPGKKMYRTGDMVRILPNGSFDHLGRRDAQIKLNGQRVELDEITGQMLALPWVEEAAAIAVKKQDGVMELRGFLVAKAGHRPDQSVLKKHLQANLPPYMVPSALVFLDQLPKTATGKTDRRRLADLPLGESIAASPGGDAPAGGTARADDTAAAACLSANASDAAAADTGDTANASDAANTVNTTNANDAANAANTVNTANTTNAGNAAGILARAATARAAAAKAAEALVNAIAAGAPSPQPIPEPALMQSAPTQDFPMQAAPVQATPAQGSSIQTEPTQAISAQAAPMQAAPIQTESIQAAPARAASTGFPAQAACGQERPLTVEELRRQLTEVWELVLERKNLLPQVSFFEQGGSSMTALNALSQYFNRRWTMTLADFYAKPTIDEQAALLAGLSLQGSLAPPQPRISEITIRPGEAAPESSEETRHTTPVSFANDRAPAGTSRREGVLLTGATGFLGVHLIKALLNDGRHELYCLVRGGDKARLAENLNWFFGHGWTASHLPAIQVWAGDIGKDDLGFDAATADMAARRIGTVIHAAADVRHYAAEAESLAVNSRGTASVIAFAEKIGAGLAHISTISVAGEFLRDAPQSKAVFTEEDRDIGQNWQDNIYVKGKFLGEAQVFQAMDRGLDARIFRVGRLVGRQSDGVFQKSPERNSFFAFLQGARHLDVLPADLADFPVELTAVDLCAAAIVTLLEGRGRVYHALNPLAPTFQELMTAVKGPLPLADRDHFESRLGQKLITVPMEQMAMLLDVWNRIKQQPFNIFPSAEKTRLELEEKGFFWPRPQIEILLSAFLAR